jgi:ribose-phosphate pyrophosphokinase
MPTFKSIKVFSCNANRPLAQEIADYIGIPLGDAEVKRFSDGEISIEINENVRGADVFIVQPTCHPANEHIMEMLIMIDALHRSSTERITAVIPYYGYARQERKVQPRVPITAKLIANLLTAAGVHRVLAVDLHAGQIQGFFDIPVDHLFSTPVILDYIMQNIKEDLVIVSPDVGGAERARAYGKRLRAPMALIDKRRPKANASEVMHVIGDVDGRTAIIVDDMIDTAGTMCSAANALIERGATKVYACCTHPVLSGPAVERIANSKLEEVLVTNTIPLSEEAVKSGKFKTLSVAPLLGEAIKRIHDADSVSSLFI